MRSPLVQRSLQAVERRFRQPAPLTATNASSFSWISHDEEEFSSSAAPDSHRGGAYGFNRRDRGYSGYSNAGVSRSRALAGNPDVSNDPYEERRLRSAQHPRVLLCWRPSWWFTRYSILSTLFILFVVMKMVVIPFLWGGARDGESSLVE
ncbi:unnamed protein product [Phytomonas sp. EM1]|nr:unnamed protein product [Phytomonas sp. EM1]|eukprot:CCW64749.1 unnamed protein product [Phytomonas sp. isolate EM1]